MQGLRFALRLVDVPTADCEQTFGFALFCFDSAKSMPASLAFAESSLFETTDYKPRTMMLTLMAKVRRRKTIVNAESRQNRT